MFRSRAIPIFVFPIMLSIGIILIPLVSNYSDHVLVLQGVDQGARWFAGHLVSAAAFGICVWAVCEIAAELQRRTSRSNAILLSLMSLGASLYAAGLGVDGIAPMALRSSGTSALAFFDGGLWVSSVFMLATIFFAFGLISLVIRIIRAGLVEGIWRYVIFSSALVFIIAPAVPSGFALYAEALASLGVFVPIGIAMAHPE